VERDYCTAARAQIPPPTLEAEWQALVEDCSRSSESAGRRVNESTNRRRDRFVKTRSPAISALFCRGMENRASGPGATVGQ